MIIILCLAAISSCEKTSDTSATAGFNKLPTLLMTLPKGYEAGEVTFSNDGFQAAVVLKKDGKMFMSINSALSPMYEDVRAPVFHANSKRYAFVARRAGKECVVLNGKEGEFYDSIEKPLITSDARLVYAAKRDDKWLVVSGDTVSQTFDSPNPSLSVSPDGKRLAFIEQNSRTKKLNLCTCSSSFKDYVRGSEYDDISDAGNNLSGSHLAYRVVKDGKQTVVLFDFRQPGCIEKEGSWYEKVVKFALSNNGGDVAFFAQRMGKYYLVNAEHEWPCNNFSMLFDISVSDKGNALYTGVVKDSIIVSFDGKVIGDRRESINDMTFSSDSNHSLFVAGPCPLIFSQTSDCSKMSYLVIDGHESKKYDKIVGPRFAPDNTHVVFRARAAGQRFLVVANKSGQILQELSPYDAVWDFKFSPDGKYVGYGVRSGQELWWKVAKILPD
jgi:dipeptidyl aminopeptidase/acylaminoacyl peptidase